MKKFNLTLGPLWNMVDIKNEQTQSCIPSKQKHLDSDYSQPRFLDFAKNVENTFAVTVVGFGFPDSVTSFTKNVYVIEFRAKSCQNSKHVTLLLLSPIVITTLNYITFLLYRLSVTGTISGQCYNFPPWH